MLRRKARFTTDADGKPIRLPVLSPNTEYVVCQDEEIPAVTTPRDRAYFADWVEYAVLGDLRTLLYGIEIRNTSTGVPRNLGGGNFLLAAACCMALEYLGQIYGEGTDSTGRAKAYTDRFLQPLDARYSEFFWLVWSTFRHGIVHGSWPQVACLRDSPSELIAFGAGNQLDDPHFAPGPGFPGPNMLINPIRFAKDLDSSFTRGFRSWLLNESDDAVLTRAAPKLLAISSGNREAVSQFNRIKAMWQPDSAA